MSIVYLSQMSRACAAELDELCQDATCECHCHDTDDLLPLFAESDDVTWLSADDRARRREATR